MEIHIDALEEAEATVCVKISLTFNMMLDSITDADAILRLARAYLEAKNGLDRRDISSIEIVGIEGSPRFTKAA